jgi:hypothetical protein
MDLKETGWEVVYWIPLTQDRDEWQALVNMIITLCSIEGGEFLDQLSDC